VTCPGIRVEVDGTGLFAVSQGPEDAPAVLFSNSLGTDVHAWEHQAEALAGTFRVVRYDARGHGRSDAPPGPYTIDRLGADAVGVLDALGIERAHVCGISLGGMVALWLAARHPERVGRAVFAATAARIGSRELWEERARAVRAGGTAAIRDLVVSRFFSPAFAAGQPRTVERFTEALLGMSAEGYAASCLALAEADLRDAVGGIRCPSLVIVGDLDVATPLAEARWLHGRIPGSGLLVLEGAAHLCNVERPGPFTEALVRFLSAP